MGLLSNRRRVLGNKPYDYEVEYLEVNETSGLAYIDTMQIINPENSILQVVFSVLGYPDNTSYNRIVSWYQSNDAQRFRIIRNDTDDRFIILQCSNTLQNQVCDFSFNTKYTAEINNNNLTVTLNGVEKVSQQGRLNATTNTFKIFGDVIDRISYARLYKLQLITDDKVVLDMIPVVRNGIGYMYDKVSHKLFGAQGGGKFIVGPRKKYHETVDEMIHIINYNPEPTGNAEILKISGNSVIFNQLYKDQVPVNNSGNTFRYYMSETIDNKVNRYIAINDIHYTEGSTNRQCINVSTMFSFRTIPTTVEQFDIECYKLFGKKLDYNEYNGSVLMNVQCSGIKVIGQNNNYEYFVPIPVTTITGKLNGVGDSQVIFDDGMNSIGNIRDEIYFDGQYTKAIKRIGKVSLKGVKWVKQPTFNRFASKQIIAKSKNSTQILFDYPNFYSGNTNVTRSIFIASNGIVYLNFDRDSVNIYTEDVIEEMFSNNTVYYPLDNPEEYIVDNFSLPISYKLRNFDTEQIITPDNTITPIREIEY